MSAWGDSWGTCTTPSEGCGDVVCGTGGWTGPKPGDPDNNISLNARGVVGGVEVSWNYPVINPHAVSHLKLLRGTSPLFELAVERAIVSGNIYVDSIPDSEIQMYFYWIQMVSSNGTKMDPIGPASAIPLSFKESTLETLTGEIDSGYLAQSLRDRIDLIAALEQNIAQEILDRITSNEALAAALAAVQGENGAALTYILNETTQRQDADGALVQSIEALAVGVAGNAAAIVEEQTARVTAEEATAEQLSILYTTVADNEAAIIAEQTARTTETSALATDITGLVATVATNAAAIEVERTARTDADSALATEVAYWVATAGNSAAALQTEITARTDADAALASQIQTAQTVLNGNISSVQTTMQTQINTVNGVVSDIGALWTAKVDVNGLVGGFGVYNNGQQVEAGFDVDRFWVGRTTNQVKPFIVDNDVVYINKARIKSGDIDTLKIAGNAVTVPVYAAVGTLVPGNNAWQQIISAPITNTSSEPMQVMCMFSGTLAFNSGARLWGFKIYVDGVFTGYALEGLSDITTLPAFNYHHWVPANSSATFSIQFFGADSSLVASFRTLTLLGTKR